MSNISVHSAVAFAEKNPVMTGLVVFVGGLAILFMLGFFKPKSSGDASSGLTAGATSSADYYSAVVADNASGNALQAVQIQTAGQVSIAQAQTAADVANNATWANVQQTQSHDANLTSLALAPFQAQANYESALVALGSVQPVMSSSSKTTGGGIFNFLSNGLLDKPSVRTETTVSVNPNAAAALSQLQGFDLTSLGLIAGH